MGPLIVTSEEHPPIGMLSNERGGQAKQKVAPCRPRLCPRMCPRPPWIQPTLPYSSQASKW